MSAQKEQKMFRITAVKRGHDVPAAAVQQDPPAPLSLVKGPKDLLMHHGTDMEQEQVKGMIPGCLIVQSPSSSLLPVVAIVIYFSTLNYTL